MSLLFVGIVAICFALFHSKYIDPLLNENKEKVHPLEIHLAIAYAICLMAIDFTFDRLDVFTASLNVIIPFVLIALFRKLHIKKTPEGEEE